MGLPPTLSQRLVVVDRDDFVQARRTEPELLADWQTTVVPVPLEPRWSALEPLRRLERSLKPGTIFVRNPFDQDRYIEVGEAYEKIAVSKFGAFAQICQLLGARRLRVEELREFSENEEQIGSVDLKSGPAHGGISGGSQQLRTVAKGIRADWVWETGQPDQEQAEKVAEQSGLSADALVIGLIRQRGHSANRLARHDLLLDISSEARSEISLALGLEGYLANGFVKTKFTGKFDKIKGASHALRLKVSVQFTED
jgi:hypothetical protein